MLFQRLAPAKVNLFLHVGANRPDGFHPLCSLVTFADVGDVVRMAPAETNEFAIEGPFGTGLPADGGNLIVRAREAFQAAFPDASKPVSLTLDKRLPIASGVGGGSADAAAALLLLRDALGRDLTDAEVARLAEIAAALGSDVPMCLSGRPCVAEGRGEVLSPPPTFPDLEVVLVNCGVASPTGPVYRAYDDAGAPGGDDRPDWPAAMLDAPSVAAFLRTTRNDLEAPAVALAPAIGETLALLLARRETLFARMSGSGATCFALCADRPGRDALALDLARAQPDWWVMPCTLAGYGG